MTSYDTIVIGAGQAGPGVAAARVGEGKRVAICERAGGGGPCLNHGCKPTKTLRASAVVANTARRAADYGVQTGSVSVDFGTAIGRVRSIIGEMQRSLDEWIASVDGLDYVMGTAQLRTDPDGRQHEVAVNGQVLTAPEIHLNVGARASRPPIEGLDSVPVMTEVELLALNELPEHLLIVGGGYIGCEFGQMFRRFGAEVTMIAGGPLAPQEDDDVRQILADTFAEEGISVIPRNLTGVRPHAGGIEAAVDDGTTVVGRVRAYAIFPDPPLGRVGMNTEQARASGRKVLKAEIGMGSVSRAILESETIGVLRILVDGDTEEILGATILGRSADELIQLIGVAQQAGVRYPTVRDALPIHPTMSEYVPSVLRSLEPL